MISWRGGKITLAALTAEPALSVIFKDGWPEPGSIAVVAGSERMPDGTHDFYATSPAPAIPDGCTWIWNEYDYYWQASCGGTWLFNDDGPVENEVNFCQKCGGRVIIAEDVEE